MLTIAGTTERIPGALYDWGGMGYHLDHPQFDAEGNGTADDTTPLNDLISKCATTGMPGYLGEGTYGVTADIDLPDNLTLIGIPGKTTIKWIGGGAPTNAVLSGNLAGALGVYDRLVLKNITVDASGYGIGVKIAGLGPNCEIDAVKVQNFATIGLDITQGASGLTSIGFRVGTIELQGLAGSRGLAGSYITGAHFETVKVGPYGAIVGPILMGIDMQTNVIGCEFVHIEIEDCTAPMRLGSLVTGVVMGNTVVQLRFSAPTEVPANITEGAFSGTVGLTIGTTGAPSISGNTAVGVHDSYGYTRAVFDVISGRYVAGGLNVTVPFLLSSALAVEHGGTGRSTLTANNLLSGNGVGQVNQIAPGAAGQVARSNGTAFVSAPLGYSDLSGVPATFAPSAHTHDDRYYTETEADAQLATKSAVGHTHDDRYYTEGEANAQLAAKSDVGHTHDDRYYTETEMNTALAGKSAVGHTHAWADVSKVGAAPGDVGAAAAAHTHDDRYYTEAEVNALFAALTALAARAYRATSNQAISAATVTKLVLNAESYDPQNLFDAVTLNQYLPNRAGYYRVYAQCQWEPIGAAERRIMVYKNGVETARGANLPASGQEQIGNVSDLVYFNGTTDNVSIYVYSNDATYVAFAPELTFATFEFVGNS